MKNMYLQIETYAMKGQQATSGNALKGQFALNGNALKGLRAHSPGQRPGEGEQAALALKGQKPKVGNIAFALTGRAYRRTTTQGAALGWELTGPSGRPCWELTGLSGRHCGIMPTVANVATDQRENNMFYSITISKRRNKNE